jgi:hypothetical protein
MALNTDRRTVDLSAFPDLVVIYLGMRVNKPRGLRTLLRFGPKISKSVADQPDGLLLHENMIFSVVPPHGGMRQYWQDFESLERWARSRFSLKGAGWTEDVAYRFLSRFEILR